MKNNCFSLWETLQFVHNFYLMTFWGEKNLQNLLIIKKYCNFQGMFIFVFHVLMNEKANQAVIRCLRRGGLCCSAQLSDSSQQQSSSYNQNRSSNNFFSLNKSRLLQWWPLKSKSSSTANSQTSNQKQDNKLGI